MATTATISISSDIAPGFGGISESMTLTQGGNLVDIDRKAIWWRLDDDASYLYRR